ncbi:phage baseplate assembly protein V [Pararobbsia silviterrae]|uniref:Gp5/Type VI secretion system Vgr protein OB-fold domain-containing protein n=1 Tax=Pararobbsia silviterrae TaxID=1792498 RepID=A0A494Y152_9BURK|nr:phage baseplate assembly protein V [Pararobbsia silviterrae]RKP55969.1 hypothetical protein D7S86_12335 [Pararobbsia silviterrae]
MNPIPTITLMTGEARRPLSALKVEFVETVHQVNAIPVASVTLSVEGNALDDLTRHVEDIAQCRPGQNASIYLRQSKAQSTLIFQGIVVDQQLKLSRSRPVLTLQLRHELQKLQNTHRSQVFDRTTDALIVANLLTMQTIPVLAMSGLDLVHDQMLQFRCSDWHFLRCRLNANGVWLFPTPRGVRIETPNVTVPRGPELRQRVTSSDIGVRIEEGQWRFNVLSQPSSLTAGSWDERTQVFDSQRGMSVPLGTGAFDCSTSGELNRTQWAFNFSSSLGVEGTRSLAKSLLMNLQSTRACGSFLTEGSTRFDLGETARVAGFGTQFDGMGIVTGITQRVSDADGWRTMLTLGSDDVVKDMSSVSRAPGLHIGVVREFDVDPTGMKRLRVKLPVLGDDCPAIWARIAPPYASALSGFCFYPEVGDEVVVCFFDDDPSCPVILGAMHSPRNPAPIDPSVTNAIKALVVTQGAQKFELRFDSQPPQVSLESPDDSVTLQNGVNIASKQDCKIDAPRVTVDADQVDATGRTSVTIRGARIDLEN